MNVTFVYTDVGIDNSRKFCQGIAQLSSCLKQAGHTTSLVHLYQEIDQSSFIELVGAHAPDMVAFSSISNLFPQIKKLAAWIKDCFDVPIIYGGPHPTLAPQECIETGLFDMICRGEGEGAMVEVCGRLAKGQDITDIKNLWVSSNGRIYKNPARPLIEDLDSLPSLDYELFDYETLVDATSMKRLVVMAGRGCPYNCTYCCNHALRQLYPNKARYVRYRSVDKVIAEIEYGLKKYPSLERVRFFDDTLTINKRWFREFAEKYRQRIGLPYSTNDRVNQIDDEIAALLKESGCTLVEFGLESGSEKIREGVMKRGTPEDQIIRAFELCKKHGIKTNAFNIIGVPGETFSTALDTIRLNAKVDPDWSYVTYFHAYVGTTLHELSVRQNLLTDKTFKSIYEGPTLKLDTITEKETVFAVTFFRPLIKLYRFYYRLPKPLSVFMDKTTAALISCRCFPKATLMALLPGFAKFNRSLRNQRKSLENALKKNPFLYRPVRAVYRFLFVRKKKKR